MLSISKLTINSKEHFSLMVKHSKYIIIITPGKFSFLNCITLQYASLKTLKQICNLWPNNINCQKRKCASYQYKNILVPIFRWLGYNKKDYCPGIGHLWYSYLLRVPKATDLSLVTSLSCQAAFYHLDSAKRFCTFKNSF